MNDNSTNEEFLATLDDYKKKLTPGKLYKIRLEDCCIEGEISATFIEWDIKYDEAVFDIGRIGPSWGKWFPEE